MTTPVTSNGGMLFPNSETLSNMFGYFKTIRDSVAKLRYFYWDGQVHLVKGKTGGQQGDPLEMLIFNLTIHHLWGRVLSKFPGARVVDTWMMVTSKVGV